MNWEFSFGWFFLGLVILIGGALVVVFYKPIADNFAHGISSYERTKFFGVIACIVGCLIMANLHTLVLELITSLVFRRQ